MNFFLFCNCPNFMKLLLHWEMAFETTRICVSRLQSLIFDSEINYSLFSPPPPPVRGELFLCSVSTLDYDLKGWGQPPLEALQFSIAGLLLSKSLDLQSSYISFFLSLKKNPLIGCFRKYEVPSSLRTFDCITLFTFLPSLWRGHLRGLRGLVESNSGTMLSKASIIPIPRTV